VPSQDPPLKTARYVDFQAQLGGTRIESSQAEGRQGFSTTPEEREHEIKSADATHNHNEERKRNEFVRRIVYSVIVGLFLASFLGAGLAVFADDDTRQLAGLSIVTSIVSGLIGAVAGYLAGLGSK
jgi:hypothetical protein